jgi:hypothetical protein
VGSHWVHGNAKLGQPTHFPTMPIITGRRYFDRTAENWCTSNKNQLEFKNLNFSNYLEWRNILHKSYTPWEVMKLCFFRTFLFELIVIEKLSWISKFVLRCMKQCGWSIHFVNNVLFSFAKSNETFMSSLNICTMISWQFSEVFNKF